MGRSSNFLGRNAVHWPILGQAWIALFGLAGATLVARFLGPKDFGVYFLALTVTSVIAIAIDLCVGQAILTKVDGYVDHARTWRLLASSLAAGAATVTAVVASILDQNLQHQIMWTLLCAAIPLTMAAMPPRAFLVLAGQLRFVATIDVVSVVIGNAVAVMLVLSTTSLAAAAATQFLVAGIRFAFLEYGWVKNGKLGLPRNAPFSKSMRALAAGGHGVYQSQLAGFVSRNGDNLIVSFVLGPVNLAQYSRAFSFLIGPLQQAQMALNPMILRDLAAAYKGDRAKAELSRISTYLLVFIVPLSVIVAALGPRITSLLLGSGWSVAGNLMILSGGLAVAMTVALPARWSLVALRNSKALAVDASLQYLILVGCGVGALLWGITGALAVNAWLISPLIAIVDWQMLPANVRGLFIRRVVPLTIGLAALSAGGIYLIGVLVHDDLIAIFCGIALYVLIVLSAVFLLRRR